MTGTVGVMEEPIDKGRRVSGLGFIHFMLLWTDSTVSVRLFRPVRHGHEDWKLCLLFLLCFYSLLRNDLRSQSLVSQFRHTSHEAFLSIGSDRVLIILLHIETTRLGREGHYLTWYPKQLVKRVTRRYEI